MSRTLIVGFAALVLLPFTAQLSLAGGDSILNKMDKLTDKDSAYKADAKVLDVAAKFVNGNPHKTYTIKVKKGDKLVIRAASVDFDTVVVVEDAKMKTLAFNDDDATDEKTFNSRLDWTAPADGEYRIIVVAFAGSEIKRKTGSFHLTVTKAQ